MRFAVLSALILPLLLTAACDRKATRASENLQGKVNLRDAEELSRKGAKPKPPDGKRSDKAKKPTKPKGKDKRNKKDQDKAFEQYGTVAD